jgi:hypothetical protein
MRTTIKGNGLDAALGSLQGFSGRRLQSAVATALTRTGVQIKQAQQSEMRDVFDRPTPDTIGSVYSTTADIGRMFVDVGIKGQAAQGDRGADRWLQWQIKGGQRSLKGFEVLLVRYGLMESDQRAVPGKAARLDGYGNVAKGQITQILSQLRVDSFVGSSRSLPRLQSDDNKATRRAKQNTIRRAYGRAGGRFIALKKGTRTLLPGIYINEGKDFGARIGFGASRRLRPVFIFVSPATYEPQRYDFYYVARLKSEGFGAELLRSIEKRRLSLASRSAR